MPSGNPPLSLIKFEVGDAVATITINRPQSLNSITPAVVHQLEQAFQWATADAAIHGIVLTGAGKAFVVGADIDFFVRNLDAGDIDRIVKFTEAGQRLVNAIDRCPKPVVARVDGAALGAGMEIALACDHVVATPRASFALPETSLGIYPGLGGTQRAPRRLGLGIAKWLIFTGKIISAADAWKIGLVQQVVAGDRLDAFCLGLAAGQLACEGPPARTPELAAIDRFFACSRIDDLLAGTADAEGDPVLARAMKQVAGKPPLALRLAERIVDEGTGLTLEAGLQLELAHLSEIFSNPDSHRLLRSRSAKRLG